jgi:hypothetical protein
MNHKGNPLQTLLLGAALLLPAAAQAQFTFTTNNGAITITGYTGFNSAVVIPDTTNGLPVTSIGISAFYGLSGVTNVTIPDSVTNIDVQAFLDCGLVSIAIPDSVINIGTAAFQGCSSLSNLTIGSGVVIVGDDAFYDCVSLVNVFIPKSVTNLLYGTAFIGCTNLTAITVDAQNPAYSSPGGVLFDKNQTGLVIYPYGKGASYAIPAGVTSIGDFAFTLCENLTNITLPDGLTNIGQYAFSGCSGLTNITLPGSIISIGQYAFSSCGGLTEISLPEGLTTIGQYAFSSTGLTNILVPASVTNIGQAAFSGVSAIMVATNNPAYSSVGGVLFDSGQTTIVEFPSGQIKSPFIFAGYTIPNGVIHIGDSAFAGCFFLTNIMIPASVASIGNDAFNECTRLTNLAIPDNVTNIGNSAFESTGLTNITIPAGVATLGVLGYCPTLRNIYFLGNAPGQEKGIGPVLFLNEATAYYLPGTTGWEEYFQSIIPTALWLPHIQTSGGSPGGQTNQFGFNINWASGQTVVVEVCTNLANPDWQPLQTNTLTTGSAWFSDPLWTNYPCRFYHLRSP